MTSAIILAGGQSRRMGRDKALLIHEGRTFLDRMVRLCRNLTSDVVVVADVADRYAVPNTRVVGDQFPDTGPVGGIVTGLACVGSGAHFVVACDMPAVSVEVLTVLMDACDHSVDVVVLELADGPEPLCAVYRHTSAPKLLRYLAEGGRSARQALNVLTTRRIEESVLRRLDPTAHSLTNINTWEDFERLRGSAE